MKKLATAIALIAGLGATGFAYAASETGTANALLLETIQLVEDTEVDFQSIPADAGTCSMALSGALSGQCAGSPDGTPGAFSVTGTAGQVVDVSVGGGTTQALVTFNPDLDGAGATAGAATLDGSGNATIAVAGNLDIQSGAPGGARLLNYTITVNYQ